eukprot:637789-Lingulodinium_polyedra.AAC.1
MDVAGILLHGPLDTCGSNAMALKSHAVQEQAVQVPWMKPAPCHLRGVRPVFAPAHPLPHTNLCSSTCPNAPRPSFKVGASWPVG